MKFISWGERWSGLSAKCFFDEMAIATSKKTSDIITQVHDDTFCYTWLRAGKFSFIVCKNVELQIKNVSHD